MSVTDELRAELTKRGVKWSNRDGFNDYKTVWHHAHTSYLLIESLFYSDTTILKVRKPTVAQAIAATPGAETCHCTTPDDAWCFRCSSCGKSFPRDELHIAHNHGEINYCPNCGARVMGVDE